MVVLGDRYESFAAASAGHIENIPICHLHGGETTEGAIDDRLRHAISTGTSIHFCAASRYKERLLNMGHPAQNVHNTGPMVLDALRYTQPIEKRYFHVKPAINLARLIFSQHFIPKHLRKTTAWNSFATYSAA